MKLVLDTNILISFFRKNPVSFIIRSSSFFDLQLFSPEYAIGELIKNKKDILKYSLLKDNGFKNKIEDLKSFVKIASDNFFKGKGDEAKSLSPHDKDVPFFALALKLECPIWSNELAFKNQNKINIFSTRDIMNMLL